VFSRERQRELGVVESTQRHVVSAFVVAPVHHLPSLSDLFLRQLEVQGRLGHLPRLRHGDLRATYGRDCARHVVGWWRMTGASDAQ
jgi:hypothetical protein